MAIQIRNNTRGHKFSPGSGLIAVIIVDDGIAVYDIEDGDEKHLLAGKSFQRIALSEDGKIAVACDKNRGTVVVDVENEEIIAQWENPPQVSGKLGTPAISPNGRGLVIGFEDRTLSYSIPGGEGVEIYEANTLWQHWPYWIDDETVAITNATSSVKIMSPEGAEIKTLQCHGDVHKLVARDNYLLLSAAQAWDLSNWSKIGYMSYDVVFLQVQRGRFYGANQNRLVRFDFEKTAVESFKFDLGRGLLIGLPIWKGEINLLVAEPGSVGLIPYLDGTPVGTSPG